MTTLRRRTAATVLALAVAAGLAACGSAGGADTTSTTSHGVTTLHVAQVAGSPYEPVTVKIAEVARIRAELPAAVRKAGTLAIGVGALPAGYPPLAFVGSDQKTLTGSEPDLARAVAAVLGLRPVISNNTWENLFIGIDSGRVQAAFSNVTDTEERKKKYDFASYRQDNLAFEVPKKSSWNFDRKVANLAGQTVAVGSGTNQEAILKKWQATLKAQGKTLTIKYFPDQNAVNLALASGRISAYFGPNPGVQYQVSRLASSTSPVRSAGTWSGAGAHIQGLIAATTKKGDGLVRPLRDALQQLIADGTYAKILAAYNLGNEAVAPSEINPPGLPVSNS